MYNLLIVDDERYTVRGMIESIQWSDIDILNVYSSFNALKAMKIIEKKDIDVIICDIEMPGLDGIELLETIKEKGYNIATIFLTGHAKFDYAQKAVKLGCFDYLLKPVEHDIIKKTVWNALDVIKKEEIKNRFFETYKNYYNLWQRQHPILMERFWQDVFSGRYLDSNWIQEYIDLYEMPLTISDQIIPVLISIEEWEIPLNARDEEIMKYAIRKVAEELLQEVSPGMVFQNHDGNNIIIVYGKKDKKKIDKLIEYCQGVIKVCKEKLHCVVSCYLGKLDYIKHLNKAYLQLLELEKNNLDQIHTVVELETYNGNLADDIICSFPFGDWKVLFKMGKGKKLYKRIEDYFQKRNHINLEIIEDFIFGLIHMVYEVLHQKGISIKKVYSVQQLSKVLELNSLALILDEIRNIILTGTQYINDLDDSEYTVLITKIKSYIKDNYLGCLSRKEIAKYVSLNPAYLSRFFKKETGQTLTEYITELRLDESLRLLSETDLTITLIAEKIGYKNYSYFSKIFKERYGVTPNEYKKNYI